MPSNKAAIVVPYLKEATRSTSYLAVSRYITSGASFFPVAAAMRTLQNGGLWWGVLPSWVSLKTACILPTCSSPTSSRHALYCDAHAHLDGAVDGANPSKSMGRGAPGCFGHDKTRVLFHPEPCLLGVAGGFVEASF